MPNHCASRLSDTVLIPSFLTLSYTMKSFIATATLVANVAAFPHLASEKKAGSLGALLDRQVSQPQGGAAGVPLPAVPPPFDAATQRINVNGTYAVSPATCRDNSKVKSLT